MIPLIIKNGPTTAFASNRGVSEYVIVDKIISTNDSNHFFLFKIFQKSSLITAIPLLKIPDMQMEM